MMDSIRTIYYKSGQYVQLINLYTGYRIPDKKRVEPPLIWWPGVVSRNWVSPARPALSIPKYKKKERNWSPGDRQRERGIMLLCFPSLPSRNNLKKDEGPSFHGWYLPVG